MNSKVVVKVALYSWLDFWLKGQKRCSFFGSRNSKWLKQLWHEQKGTHYWSTAKAQLNTWERTAQFRKLNHHHIFSNTHTTPNRVYIPMHNTHHEAIIIEQGDRVAQINLFEGEYEVHNLQMKEDFQTDTMQRRKTIFHRRRQKYR